MITGGRRGKKKKRISNVSCNATPKYDLIDFESQQRSADPRAKNILALGEGVEVPQGAERQAREVLTSSVALGVIDSAHQAADFTADTTTVTPLHWLDPRQFYNWFCGSGGKKKGGRERQSE